MALKIHYAIYTTTYIYWSFHLISPFVVFLSMDYRVISGDP